MNYVFFFPDELRAKSLSCYGNPYIKTPNFDRLAEEGTLFEQNYTTHPVCVASRCSLFTGWFPHVSGFRTLRYYLQPHHPNFMQTMKDAGFETFLFGKNHVFSKEVFKKCVDHFVFEDFADSIKSKSKGKKLHTSVGISVKDYTMLLDPLPDDMLEELDDTLSVQAAIDVIRNRKKSDPPFFIYIPTLMPHPPYKMVKRYYNAIADDSLPPVLPSVSENVPGYRRLIREYRQLGETDEHIFRKIHAVYLGMCLYSDMLLGRILDALEETGLWQDTTVVCSSDHGDWAGDYGLVEKWPNAFDDDITRVPLIIRTPGGAKGHRVKELTQTFDIFPTILDLEQIEIEHTQFGVSLKKQLFGDPGDETRTVYCEGGYDTHEPHCFEGTKDFAHFMVKDNVYYPKMIQQQERPESVCRGTMMRNARYKLNIRTNGENELYDMLSDPDELNNLYYAPDMQTIVNEMQNEMLQWYIHTSDVVPKV